MRRRPVASADTQEVLTAWKRTAMATAPIEWAKLRRDLGRWIRAASGLGMERGDMLELFTAEVDAGHWGQATG